MRGEYALLRSSDRVYLELPPRARRIPQAGNQTITGNGTTSACAENTIYHAMIGPFTGNYLRVRGEYADFFFLIRGFAELPPRARRIQHEAGQGVDGFGTTSACAENTPLTFGERHLPRNYLRVRGEYTSPLPPLAEPRELPPRARRIPQTTKGRSRECGTTSACAENTGQRVSRCRAQGNYLRVRGEYPPVNWKR